MSSRFWVLIIPIIFNAQCASAGARSPKADAALCGRVVEVSCAGAVNIQVAHPSKQQTWRFRIPAERRPLFGSSLEDRYDQRLVCVTPKAETAANGDILIREPDQIVITDPGSPIRLSPDVARTCDPGVHPPVQTKNVYARFTAEAMRAKVKGSVFLRAVVDQEGSVSEVIVVQPLEPSQDEAAREAVAQWKFRPATRDGKPVAIAVNVQMAYTTK